MRLPAELCKMQRKKRETDGFSKNILMTPPGSHPTSGFGARHGLPKFLGIRETERSRRGTPCCTYRYRLWSFAGCVRVAAPCFFTMLHHFPRAASDIRHQHGSGSDAAHPGFVPIFCAGMPCKLARRQCHFPAYCPILSA